MKNFKKIAFGALVGAMAIGFSAFTNAKNFAAGDVFGNKQDNGTYDKLSAAYNPMQCTSSTRNCGYSVTSAGASHVTGTSLSASQITTDLANGWIQAEPSQGVYTGN